VPAHLSARPVISEAPNRPTTEMLELSRPECLRLLAANGIGRIAVSVTEWDHPLVRPVNYVFDQSSQSVLIRSASGSKLHALLRSARAAFEIDGTDEAGRIGWSVIIVGVAEEITSRAELRRIESLGLESWAPGDNGHWISIRTNVVSGRRIALVTDNGAGSPLVAACAPHSSAHSPDEMMASVVLAPELHLRNGATVSIRKVSDEDEALIFAFLTGLTDGSRRLRFFSAAVDLRVEARRGAVGEDSDHHGLVATSPGQGVVGHAIYVRLPNSERAEVAVEVADDFHHLGLATLLMIRLAQVAERHHITCFFAEVLPENRDMLAVFRDGFAATTRSQRDEVDVEFPTAGWRAAHALFER
jgi:nitroimidazol reductase NimA-like FMN-containing flavoprotein (pyridoxamine 5'-phosphate oxidase superfamily)/GNAT superfamily N-acetyltransferase